MDVDVYMGISWRVTYEEFCFGYLQIFIALAIWGI